jgi:3-deoxy-alpha-D-manno-octulosonate 8-oxidase
MAEFAGVDVPSGVTRNLADSDMDRMMDVSLGLGPLWENALGPAWRERMTRDRLRALYERM